MLSSTAILTTLTLAGLSLAQSSTISLYIPGADTQPLVGSIIGSDSTATTYALQCAPGTDDSDCGFAGGFTLTEGPATARYVLSQDIEADSSTIVAFTGVINCSLDTPGSSAICTQSFSGVSANDPGVSTETFTGTDFTYMPVVITGSAASPSNTEALVTPTGTGASVTGTGASGSGSGTGSGKGSATSTSTGGMPMVTGRAGWVVGGVALAAALV